MPHSDITSIINQIESFPALPTTVLRVMEITGNPESSAQDLMTAILPDQSMGIAILKIANSAFFGRPREVSSIEEAIVVLGFNEIRNIILTQAIFNSFQQFRQSKREDIDALWQHSYTCGLTAKIIAAHTNGHSSSQHFIAGLIHDIGKITMLMALPIKYTPVQEFFHHLQDSHPAEEEELFGISHDHIGMRLLNRWLFPEQLCISTGYHHHPETTPANTEFSLIVQMADILSHVAYSTETFNGFEILELIKNMRPESVFLWNRYNLNWQAQDIEIWLTDLRTDLANEAFLTIFRS